LHVGLGASTTELCQCWQYTCWAVINN